MKILKLKNTKKVQHIGLQIILDPEEYIIETENKSVKKIQIGT